MIASILLRSRQRTWKSFKVQSERLSLERMLRSFFCAALSVKVSPLEMDNAMLTSESVMYQHKTV